MKKIASIALLFTIIGSSTAFAVQAPAPSKALHQSAKTKALPS